MGPQQQNRALILRQRMLPETGFDFFDPGLDFQAVFYYSLGFTAH